MSNELLPCPFCGSEAELVSEHISWQVRCTGGQQCATWPVTNWRDKKVVIAAWNRRFVKTCTWTLDVDYGSDDRDYKTSCGQMFSLIEGGPKDNNMNFCCYCGGELIEDNQVRTDAGE